MFGKILMAAFFTVALLLAAVAGNFTPRASMHRSMTREMVCVAPNGEVQWLGSTIPVSEHVVLTAAHMFCGELKSILLMPAGVLNEMTVMKIDQENDMMLLTTALPIPGPYATFRAPIIGEHVTGYGFGLPNLTPSAVYSEGAVSFLNKGLMYTTMPIFPGMSGSAVFGEDGSVVGMVDAIDGTFVAGGQVFLPIYVTISGDLLQQFLPHL